MSSNRFKRAEEQKKVAPGGNTEKEVSSVESGDSLVDLFPKKEEKEKRKTYTFYLSEEAFAKVDKFSKEVGRSRSEAMDLLIKKFL
jgi:hypothetical protein